MTIDYYAINDPETVAHGITLRSAIAGFFYKNVADAYDTKGKLVKCFEVAGKTEVAGNTERLDPFENVLPITTRGSSGKQSGSDFSENLDPITENSDSDDFDEIHGNTYCRIIHDAENFYPNLKLPSTVYVKLYYYSSRLWEENDLTCLEIPDKQGYYDMFFNELVINEKFAESPFAAKFPRLLVSVSGKISLIDFGLSDCTNNEERKRKDFKSLYRYSVNIAKTANMEVIIILLRLKFLTR